MLNLYLVDVYTTLLFYMFRFISHNLQGELTNSLFKTICFYKTIVYGKLLGHKYQRHKFVGLQYIYNR